MAAEENEKLAEVAALSTRWTTNEPFYRMYICIIQDEAKLALVAGDAVLAKNQLDARNNEGRPRPFEEVVADLFNDPAFPANTEVLPNLHSDFTESIDCSFAKMPGTIKPEHVKGRMADSKAKLSRVRVTT